MDPENTIRDLVAGCDVCRSFRDHNKRIAVGKAHEIHSDQAFDFTCRVVDGRRQLHRLEKIIQGNVENSGAVETGDRGGVAGSEPEGQGARAVHCPDAAQREHKRKKE